MATYVHILVDKETGICYKQNSSGEWEEWQGSGGGGWGATEHTAIGNNAPHHAQAHTVASHSDTTATGANLNTLIGGGETALHSHAGDGGAGAAVATGTYVGNDADNRQITTGFKCTFVICLRVTSAGRATFGSMTSTIDLSDGVADKSDLLIHATNGFVVDQLYMNIASNTYYYWAISE